MIDKINKTKVKSKVETRKNKVIKPKVKSKLKKNRNNKVRIMLIVDYTFLISLALTVIFGMQTNEQFLLPFIIVLVVTIVCMGIILVNAIYSKIKKIFRKDGK